MSKRIWQLVRGAALACLVALALGDRTPSAPAVEQPLGSLTVRVDAAAGAPRLLVNGQPVRSRMFWGGPGSAPLRIAREWTEIQFEFTASGGATNGTMHFRFGNEPGDVFLDDLKVIDLDTHEPLIPETDFESGPDSFATAWTSWPTGAANTVGAVAVEPGVGRNRSQGLRVKLNAPPDGRWPDFHLYHHTNLVVAKGHRYRVEFQARADRERQLAIAFYQPGRDFIRLGGPPDSFGPQIQLAAEAGVHFVSFPCPMPWPQPGEEVDWSAVDAACEMVLRANPQALLLPRIGMNPPAWWQLRHPDDVMQWEDGRRAHMVVASPQYRRDAAERLAALVAHLEDAFGNHVAGYHPCGQNTGEWFYEDTWQRPLSGYAPADVAAWHAWLAARRRPLVPVPSPAARHAAPAGVFRDPIAERTLVDWAEFQQEMMADCVIELARAVRTASRGRKLVVFFYGYSFEFAAVSTGPAVAGHYALRKVLDCPDVDVLCSPISYFDRGLAQSAPSMTAAESVALAGKMWLNEDDTHTYLATGDPPGSKDHVRTLEETNDQLVRNVAQESLRNFGTWWMDLGSSGWFNDARMWAEMKRLRGLDEALLREPTPFRPDVAAVVDERAMLRVAAGGTSVTRPGIYEAREPLGRLGAPYGQYLLEDVLAGKVPAKLLVFLNAWSLSPTERENLLRETRGRVRVWCYAPGWFDRDQMSPPAMKQLTGFHLQPTTVAQALATPTTSGRERGLERVWGSPARIEPLFAVADARDDEVLARYANGAAAVALRRDAEGVSLFVGVPGLTSELLRLAARQAGVHLFAQADCNVYANGPFVAIHAATAGPLTLDTGKPDPVVDVLTGAVLGPGPQITLPLRRGETRVLRFAGRAIP